MNHIEPDPIQPPEPAPKPFCVSHTETKFEYYATATEAENEFAYQAGLPDPAGSIIEVATWENEDQEWIRTQYNRKPEQT